VAEIDWCENQTRSVAQTSEGRSLRKATEEMEFNVPQPIAAFLHQLANSVIRWGKQDLNIPVLPTARAQGMGEYHAPAITGKTNSLFEVPALGVARDMVMSLW